MCVCFRIVRTEHTAAQRTAPTRWLNGWRMQLSAHLRTRTMCTAQYVPRWLRCSTEHCIALRCIGTDSRAGRSTSLRSQSTQTAAGRRSSRGPRGKARHMVCNLLSVACCILSVACCILSVACCILSVACCILPVACCILSVASCMLYRKSRSVRGGSALHLREGPPLRTPAVEAVSVPHGWCSYAFQWAVA